MAYDNNLNYRTSIMPRANPTYHLKMCFLIYNVYKKFTKNFSYSLKHFFSIIFPIYSNGIDMNLYCQTFLRHLIKSNSADRFSTQKFIN